MLKWRKNDMVGQIFSTDLLKICLEIGRFWPGRVGRFLTAPEKPRQISKIRQIFYDNHGTDRRSPCS